MGWYGSASERVTHETPDVTEFSDMIRDMDIDEMRQLVKMLNKAIESNGGTAQRESGWH